MSTEIAAARHLPDDWWPAPLPANVVIGPRSHLYSTYAFLHYRSTRDVGVRIGADTGVYDGTVFELGPDGQVEIGDFATVVAPVIATNGRVVIGDHAMISHDVHILDSPVALPPDDADRLGTRPAQAPTFVLGDNCWVGTKAVLLPGCALGEGAIVGAGSVVDFDVPPFSIVAGNPARIVGSSPPGDARRD
ncbi:N/A [soil metagenome]